MSRDRSYVVFSISAQAIQSMLNLPQGEIVINKNIKGDRYQNMGMGNKVEVLKR